MNRTLVKILTVMLGVAAGVCVLASIVVADSGRHDQPGIAPIDSYPLGKSYGAWVKDWWTWRLETPYDINPAVNNNPCSGGQNGNVWFLASDAFVDYWTSPGVPENRECTVPEGTSLFFPLINNGYFAWSTDLKSEQIKSFVRKVTLCDGPVHLSVKIDGKSVDNPEQYYEESPYFSINLPANNIYKAPPTSYTADVWYPSADTGYYLFLRPLSVGRHTIEWTADWHKCGYAQYLTPNMYFITNYTINVTHR